MKDGVRTFLNQIADHLISRDSNNVMSFFAPWLDSLAKEQFKKAIVDTKRRTREMIEDEEIGPPDGFELDENSSDIRELQEDFKTDGILLPEEITPENFLGWWCISVTADDDE